MGYDEPLGGGAAEDEGGGWAAGEYDAVAEEDADWGSDGEGEGWQEPEPAPGEQQQQEEAPATEGAQPGAAAGAAAAAAGAAAADRAAAAVGADAEPPDAEMLDAEPLRPARPSSDVVKPLSRPAAAAAPAAAAGGTARKRRQVIESDSDTDDASSSEYTTAELAPVAAAEQQPAPQQPAPQQPAPQPAKQQRPRSGGLRLEPSSAGRPRLLAAPAAAAAATPAAAAAKEEELPGAASVLALPPLDDSLLAPAPSLLDLMPRPSAPALKAPALSAAQDGTPAQPPRSSGAGSGGAAALLKVSGGTMRPLQMRPSLRTGSAVVAVPRATPAQQAQQQAQLRPQQPAPTGLAGGAKPMQLAAEDSDSDAPRFDGLVSEGEEEGAGAGGGCCPSEEAPFTYLHLLAQRAKAAGAARSGAVAQEGWRYRCGNWQGHGGAAAAVAALWERLAGAQSSLRDLRTVARPSSHPTCSRLCCACPLAAAPSEYPLSATVFGLVKTMVGKMGFANPETGEPEVSRRALGACTVLARC